MDSECPFRLHKRRGVDGWCLSRVLTLTQSKVSSIKWPRQRPCECSFACWVEGLILVVVWNACAKLCVLVSPEGCHDSVRLFRCSKPFPLVLFLRTRKSSETTKKRLSDEETSPTRHSPVWHERSSKWQWVNEPSVYIPSADRRTVIRHNCSSSEHASLGLASNRI